MVTISVAVAQLQAMFFIRLWWERSWKYVLTILVETLGAVLILLPVWDVGFRTGTYLIERQRHDPVVEMNATGNRALPY